MYHFPNQADDRTKAPSTLKCYKLRGLQLHCRILETSIDARVRGVRNVEFPPPTESLSCHSGSFPNPK